MATRSPPRRGNSIGPAASGAAKSGGSKCRLLPLLKCIFVVLGSAVLALNRLTHRAASRSINETLGAAASGGAGRGGIPGLRRPRAERKLSDSGSRVGEAFAGGGRADGGGGGDDEEGGGPPYLTATPLLVFASGEAENLKKTLSAVLEHHPVNLRFGKKHGGPIVGSPLIISQGGGGGGLYGHDGAVADANSDAWRVIETFRTKFEHIGVSFFVLRHERGGRTTTDVPRAATGGAAHSKKQDPSEHYGWALGQVFSGEAYEPPAKKKNAAAKGRDAADRNGGGFVRPPSPDRVVVVEEDVQIAPDFFSLLSALAPRLDSDESLMAASARNDNGGRELVGDPRRLVRSDDFPGFGWMMPRRVWDEIGGAGWPRRDWGDWLMHADVRKGRQFIRPEISRAIRFRDKGRAGTNQKRPKAHLNTANIKWEDQDLSYLDRDLFREKYYKRVMEAKAVTADAFLDAVRESSVRLVYRSHAEFARYARRFRLRDDERGGVARSAFENIVDFRPFLATGKDGKKKVPSKFLAFIAPPLAEMKKNLEEGKDRSPEDFARGLLLNREKRTGDLSAFQ